MSRFCGAYVAVRKRERKSKRVSGDMPLKPRRKRDPARDQQRVGRVLRRLQLAIYNDDPKLIERYEKQLDRLILGGPFKSWPSR